MIDELFTLLKEVNTELNLPQNIIKLEQMQEIYNKKNILWHLLGSFQRENRI